MKSMQWIDSFLAIAVYRVNTKIPEYLLFVSSETDFFLYICMHVGLKNIFTAIQNLKPVVYFISGLYLSPSRMNIFNTYYSYYIPMFGESKIDILHIIKLAWQLELHRIQFRILYKSFIIPRWWSTKTLQNILNRMKHVVSVPDVQFLYEFRNSKSLNNWKKFTKIIKRMTTMIEKDFTRVFR